ncbi:MAG: hypothetical protein D6805_04595 [Planctomycetota bacterium]|nr:MAG: hypothetical protein D6805_04595 [Planctomycetota bacterium]
MKFTKYLILALAILPAPITKNYAQEEQKKEKIIGYGVRMPNWTIKPEISKLENSMEQYNDLIKGLDKANSKLKKDLAAYLKNPTELLASRIEKRMAAYAGKILKDFNNIIASQDEMLSNFNALKRKLSKYHTYLSYKEKLLKEKIDEIKKERKKIEKQLIKMALKLKQLPKNSPERKALKRVFSRMYYRYRLQNRYVIGYNRNYRNYSLLTKNLRTLVGIFGNLEDKFKDLIANLELEKKFLIDNIRLQVDNLMVKKLLREGITHGKHAIKNVTEKMAKIYLNVDNFSKIHDRINRGLSNFSESQRVLLDVSKQINSVGMSGKGSLSDIEQVINSFAKKATEDEEEESKE